MKKLLLSALAVILSVSMYAQPNIENYENPVDEVPIGSYAVPYGAMSEEWLIIAPGSLTEILNAHNDGMSVHWEGVLAEIEALPQVGDVASLTNLLANYIPEPSDFPEAGPKLCCIYYDFAGPYRGQWVWCWAYDCGNCEAYCNQGTHPVD